MKRPAILMITLLATHLVTACGSAPPDETRTPEAKRADMNLTEGKAHYTSILEEIRHSLRCEGRSLTWRVTAPEEVDGFGEIDDSGNTEEYAYRSPLYVSPTPCVGKDFSTAVTQISDILKPNGGLQEDVTLDPDADVADGGEVKWLDGHGGTWTFSSEKSSALSLSSGRLTRP